MILDGVVVLVDGRVDGPRLLVGDGAVLAGAEVVLGGVCYRVLSVTPGTVLIPREVS